tara:strand:+ start:238 stop:1887 length:1650 start_codon:yes stop_codon:yes gene_type:complete
MICKVSCSFGEIIDKVTILKIKLKHANLQQNNKLAKINLNNEINAIYQDVPKATTNDDLFNLLFDINQQLWDLEDNIRLKSKHKQFDQTYISYAEKIHHTNDLRYKIKRKINEKYKSTLFEEKFYTQQKQKPEIKELTMNELQNINKCKEAYFYGQYNHALSLIQPVMDKYENATFLSQHLIDLFVSYSNVMSALGLPFKYFNKLIYFYENLSKINVSSEFRFFFLQIYCLNCLHQKQYKLIKDIVAHVGSLTGPNITLDNQSFFTESRQEVLLLHENGGLGDYIMGARFIPILCQQFPENKIIFLMVDKLLWFFQHTLGHLKNLLIWPHSKKQFLPKFNHHCSLFSLTIHLGYEYKTLPFEPYINSNIINLNTDGSRFNKLKNKLNEDDYKVYLFNWHGNQVNKAEKFNRQLNLTDAIPFLSAVAQMEHVVLMTPTLDITAKERKILKKYKVGILKDIIPKFDQNKTFEDTMYIWHLPQVQGLISTDTSLVHLALTSNIKTYVLLTKGCEWRWTKDNKTNWYPNAILLRQTNIQDWTYPLDKLRNNII